MTQAFAGESITVKNQEQEVTRQFNDTAPHLGHEEQTRNGFEGDGQNLPTKLYNIPIRWPDNPKCEKFAMWNNNSAMDHCELDEFTDLSASKKNLSLNGNFGRGEKASMLPYNPNGLVWISCKAGNVNMITLAANQSTVTGEYVFIKTHQYDPNGKGNPTADPYTNLKTVMRLVDKDDGVLQPYYWHSLVNQYPELLDTSSDWTLKIALGSHDEQDTVRDPYNGFASKPKQCYWGMQIAFRRFFRIRDDLDYAYFGSTSSLKSGDAKKNVKIDTGIKEKFISLEQVLDKANNDPASPLQKEVVLAKSSIAGNIKIHYVHDPDKADFNESDTTNKRFSWDKGNKITSEQLSGVIYKDELYARRSTGNNTHQPMMQHLGIHSNTKNFTVFVEIDNNAPVTSDSDRQHINWKYLGEGSLFSKEQVVLEDFSQEIIQNMPQWFKDAVTSVKRASGKAEEAGQKSLQDIFNKTLSRGKNESDQIKEKRDPNPNPKPRTVEGSSDETKTRTPKKVKKVNDVIRGRGNVQAPKVIIIDSEKELANDYPGLIDKAVQYREEAEGSVLIVNSYYGELIDSIDYVFTYSGASDSKLDPEVREEFNDAIRDQLLVDMITVSGRTIASGLKRRNESSWSDDSIKKSLTPESITIAIDYMWEDKGKLTNKFKKEVDTRMKLVGSTEKELDVA